jgi:lysozyme family protein
MGRTTQVNRGDGAASAENQIDNAQAFDLGGFSMPLTPEEFAAVPPAEFLFDAALQDPTLRQGEKGESVRRLQERLKHVGFDLKVDGDFGPKTLEAVQSFQRRVGLEPDGIVGPRTWAKLAIEDPANKPASPPTGDAENTAPTTRLNDWRDAALKVSGGDRGYQAFMCFVRRWEGGFTVDHAGPTNFGITQPFYDKFLSDNKLGGPGSRKVVDLTEAESVNIYHDQIWKRGGVGAIAGVSARLGVTGDKLGPGTSSVPLAIALGNGAVNYGPGRAPGFLADAFAAHGFKDGTLEARTEAAVKAGAIDKVLDSYLDKERKHYDTLGVKPQFEKFHRGWLNRHTSVREALRGELVEGVPKMLLGKDVAESKSR